MGTTRRHRESVLPSDKRGTAWHYREDLQGDESNHYTGPVPVEDVRRRLFNWRAVEGTLRATAVTDDGVVVCEPRDRKAIMRMMQCSSQAIITPKTTGM